MIYQTVTLGRAAPISECPLDGQLKMPGLRVFGKFGIAGGGSLLKILHTRLGSLQCWARFLNTGFARITPDLKSDFPKLAQRCQISNPAGIYAV